MRAGVALVAAALVAAPAGAGAQPYHLDDSLRGSTAGNPSGGAFGPGGWTVTAATDRIWYAVPRLAQGYVEFTLANVTVASLPLPDHEVFAMYEDGYGIGEPIPYSPAFRNNHYKTLVRIYGMVEPARVGNKKLMWGMCPSGAPGYDACGCASFFDEPFADPGPWTGDPVRIRVEWGGGFSRLLRDGVEVVGVDWSASGLDFGPSELHLMLGSPRNDGGLSAMPIGATFADLVIDGTEGPLAVCPGSTTPDAGPAADAGACTGGAIADSTAAVWEPGPYPDPADLNVEGDPGVPSAIVYLRFPEPAGPVTSATLTLETSSSPSAAGGSGQPCRVDGATWDEATLTWANRPAVSTACAGGARAVAPSEVVSWDVTSLVAPGATPGAPIDLAVVSEDPNGAHYLSREAGGCDHGPRLALTLAPLPDGGPTDGDGGSGGDGAPPADASSPGNTGGVAGGCGCTAARPRAAPALAALALVAMAAALAHTRRRRP